VEEVKGVAFENSESRVLGRHWRRRRRKGLQRGKGKTKESAEIEEDRETKKIKGKRIIKALPFYLLFSFKW